MFATGYGVTYRRSRGTTLRTVSRNAINRTVGRGKRKLPHLHVPGSRGQRLAAATPITSAATRRAIVAIILRKQRGENRARTVGVRRSTPPAPPPQASHPPSRPTLRNPIRSCDPRCCAPGGERGEDRSTARRRPKWTRGPFRRRAFRTYRVRAANDISVFPSNLAALRAILKQFYTSRRVGSGWCQKEGGGREGTLSAGGRAMSHRKRGSEREAAEVDRCER